MQIVEHSNPLMPSTVFQLWITQWRVGILDSCEANLVLGLVLRSLRTKRIEDPFWKFLRQFLAPSTAETETSPLKDGSEVEHLLHCAGSLQPQQAKSLLEYLSQCHALNEEDLEFWSAVHEAIELQVVPCEPVCPGSRLSQAS